MHKCVCVCIKVNRWESVYIVDIYVCIRMQVWIVTFKNWNYADIPNNMSIHRPPIRSDLKQLVG